MYDRFGNRWQQNSTVGGPQPQYTFDSNNHISGSGVVYDALGNVVNDGIGDAYTYDAENRIIAMTNGSNTYNYIYDALGRRVAMKENGVLADEFLYDQAGRKVVSFDGNGNLVAQEFYAGNRHLATYLASTNQMYFHHTDWLGTVRIDTDANGNQAQICYSWPFGDNRSCNGVFTSANLFTDLFLDPDNTDHALYRQLSTTQGRWLSPDPAGLAAADLTNPQSLNLYAYVLNNPLNAVDPLGLQCQPDDNGGQPCPPPPPPPDPYWYSFVWEGYSGPLPYSEICLMFSSCPPPEQNGGNGGSGGATNTVSKSYKANIPCQYTASQTMQTLESSFSQFGNYSRLLGLESVSFFPPTGLSPGSTIPISVSTFGYTQQLSVRVQSINSGSMTFTTNPGHLLYPAYITFAASSAPSGSIDFTINLGGTVASPLEFRFGGSAFEDAQWNHFLGQVSSFCNGG